MIANGRAPSPTITRKRVMLIHCARIGYNP